MTKRNAIILAAGKGTRMRSKLYKVLHQVCGKTMVEHVLTQLEKAKIDNIITIVGFGAETVEQQLGHRTKYALQEQQLGTGHAVMQTKDLLANEDGETIIVSGDTPLFTAETFEKLFEYHEQRHAAATILTSIAPDPTGYGRIVRIVTAYKMDNFDESMGVNDRVALARANKVMRNRINTHWMREGVSMIDPETTYIDADVKIGRDTVIEGGVVIKGHTEIGNDCYIGAGSRIIDSKIHDGVKIISSTLQEAEMHNGSDIGPNSHLRPEAEIGENVHIGNFCEVKKAYIGEGTKVGHLTYIGNATLGKDINVGCGVVFVNYDGTNKHHTNVGDHAFIGSNSNLVAPVNIAKDSFVAAGSTITDSTEQYDMAIARARQVNKENYAKKLPW